MLAVTPLTLGLYEYQDTVLDRYFADWLLWCYELIQGFRPKSMHTASNSSLELIKSPMCVNAHFLHTVLIVKPVTSLVRIPVQPTNRRSKYPTP